MATRTLAVTKSFKTGDKVVPVGAPVDATFESALTVQVARRIGQAYLTVASRAGSKRYHCTVNGATEIYRASDLRLLQDVQHAAHYKKTIQEETAW